MKITADEEYGLRILLTIAKLSYAEDSSTKNLATISQIAEKEGITHDYAVIFLTKLKKIGLIESIRGKNGGYKLSKSPENISLYEVMNGLGNSIFDSDFCQDHKGIAGECTHLSNCSIKPVWHTISNIMDSVFKKVTLEQLLNKESLEECLSESYQEGVKVQDFLDSKLRFAGG